MKKFGMILTFAVACFLTGMLTGCDPIDMDTINTSISLAETGGSMLNTTFTGLCASGKLSTEKCQIWNTSYPKLIEMIKTAKLVATEYVTMKDKTTKQKVLQAVANLKVYFDQLSALIEAWKK